MTGEQALVFLILAGALVAFATDKFRVDVVALCVLVTLVLSGVLEADEALSGLSNPAVVTVFAVFILSGAFVATGVADRLANAMLRFAGTSQWRVVATLMLTCGTMSAFMNNIGATAILLPAALVIAERTGIAASKLLMPLAFASLMGGNLTAIGTPPNILANGIMSEHPDLEPFGFFDFAPTGAPILAVGVLYMVTAGILLLPNRRRSGRLMDNYTVDEYLSTVRVGADSPLIGQSIEELGADGESVRILAVQHRADAHRAPPEATMRIASGDRLTVQASLDELAAFAATHAKGEELDVDDSVIAWTHQTPDADDDDGGALHVLELMIAPDSALIGKQLNDVHFRRQYDTIALAMQRRRGEVRVDISNERLQAGDSIVVSGEQHRLDELFDSEDFIALHSPSIRLRRSHKAPLAIAVMAAVLLASAFGLIAISIAMLAGALALVLTNTMTMDDAYEAVDWKAVFLVAGMLPLGTAMEQTGAARLLADAITNSLGSAGPLWVLLGIYAITTAITSIVANAAATVLIVPIAIDAAITLGVNPQPFVMATVIAASTAFLLPIGHQVNVLIYTPGDYRFSDFARVGAGLTALIALLVAIWVPIVWPF